jgi:fucose permease
VASLSLDPEPTGYRLSRAALAGGFLAFFVSGGVAALYGPSAPEFRRAFGVDELVSGLPASVHPLAALVGELAWAWLLRRGTSVRLLAVGAGVLGLGAFGVAAAPSMVLVLATVVGLGLGFGLLSNGMNSLYPRMTGSRAATLVVCMHGVFGVGAVSLPLVLAGLGHRGAFLAVAVVAAVAVPLLLRTSSPPAAAFDPTASPPPRRHVLAFSTVFGSYVAVEAATATWLATYLEFRGWSPGAAAGWTSAFWLAITGGRFAFALVMSRIRPGRLVQVVLPVAAVGLALAGWTVTAPLGFVLAGLCMAPVFPTAMVWLPRALPSAAGATTAAMLAAITGATLSPLLVGAVGSGIGVGAIPFTLAGLAVVAALTARAVGRRFGVG